MPEKKVPYSHIDFVLDRSGSMGNLVADTVGGFNTFIAKQKEAPGKATVSRHQFNNQFTTDYEFVDIKDVKDLTPLDYVPGGGTALNDAIGRAVVQTQAYLDKLKASRRRRPDKVYIVTITDGEENSSTEFRDVSKLKTLLEQKQSEKEVIWEFIFLGANLDVQRVAHTFSIPMGKVASYTSNQKGTEAMYANVASYTSNQKGTEAMYANVASAMTRSRLADADLMSRGGVLSVDNFEFSADERSAIEDTK